MINLFHIPNYTIDTSQFSHSLHGDIVDIFTANFCKYVGAKYGCPVNSATNAIFLLSYYKKLKFTIPTMLPPVVLNAIINGGSTYEFTDDPWWVGNTYNMTDESDPYYIIDSAQEVKKCLDIFRDNAIVIYSFYPTKPVGSCDGGMICSNDENIINFFKTVTMNGMSQENNSWERKIVTPGWKMYMNSIQAYIANENLKKLDEKKHNIRIIRNMYNEEFGYNRTSDHLYTIMVKNNIDFIQKMQAEGIQCGIHYRCLHKQDIYKYRTYEYGYPSSETYESHIVSIPLHEKLTRKDAERVIQCVKNIAGTME